ncbi:PadR family transcriptional regulator [Aldersonia sp. NBC_00410]|uniref:PadR family transcriptional regulator n=1 Tax=Aldersonia sp. NBC_00410 TaxID=2975954 RepID=UPI00225B1BF5|nr:PadR family transcriptional regulator [Aldersonia sp. NBC_00410]MCX5045224.1 PadR family transcriptional regulator [Aldersonia sp. NBC_00410]
MQYQNDHQRDEFGPWMNRRPRGGRMGRPELAERGHDHRHGPRGHGPGFGPGGPGFGPGFGPGAPFGRGRGRGGRGRRGDVRAAILLLLEDRPMHGYELIQQIRERSNDVWRPSPGSIYPALSQLEDEGLLLIEKIAGRKTATLTEAGRQYIESNRDELGDPWADVNAGVGDQALDLRALVGQLMGAAGQVAMAGTPEQAKRAGEVLTEARRAMYRILAEDDQADEVDGADEADQQGSDHDPA